MADASVAFPEDGEGDGDSAKSEIFPLHPSSLLLKLERGGCDLTAHWALLWRYDRGVSTVKLCTLICAYGMWTPLSVILHIRERK